MSIIIKSTKIKTGFYLLLPKSIAELIGVKDNTRFKLEVKYKGKKIIQYTEQKDKRKRTTRRRKTKSRGKKRRYRK